MSKLVAVHLCVERSDSEHCGADDTCQTPEQCLDASGRRVCYVPCGPDQPCAAGKCTSKDGFTNVCAVP